MHANEKPNNGLPRSGFVRLNTILTVIPISKSTWWAGVKARRFPQPVKLGPRITAWRARDIQGLIDGMGRADPKA
jgi:prophage regulatory protein